MRGTFLAVLFSFAVSALAADIPGEIPEPGTVGMVATGAIALAVVAWRRRRRG